ncbi:hypothetical protein BDY21DRAFT_387618 [Lineolata rhizophorae]|uniref:NAD-dependent 15-hydroxyprostaglandin dehydrogenase n=1 Tax=Lineolata rhizophorae TaxID=578093 RepID=A0A6A6NRR3_9PEZI|nr:hypothetical protein BDY21DRAFT_387618 [Lineolata rhizophorae]
MATQIPFSVEGKAAIVTGAGSGINLAFTRLLLSRGCSVLLADLSLRSEAEELLTKYPSSSSGPAAVFQRTDVTHWPDLDAMFVAARKAFGTIDIVCPGAGVYEPRWSSFWHPPGSASVADEGKAGSKKKAMPSKDDPAGGRYAQLDINLTHPVRVTQLAIAEFLSPASEDAAAAARPQRASPDNPKRILHISSIAGQTADLNVPLYVASKWAIAGFSRSLAALEPTLGIRVNCVSPGLILTPLWTEHPEKLRFVDMERDVWATAEEVAEAMLRCVEDPLMVGGTVLEVGHEQTRVVSLHNDPGPRGAGHVVSRRDAGVEEVFGWLKEEGWGKAKL